MKKLTDARLIDLARHARTAGEVIVAEAAAQVPFRIERIFTPDGASRRCTRPARASTVFAIHDLRQRRCGRRVRRRQQ